MRGGVIGARWIDRENYHITLRFIGDIDDGLAREIAYELDGVEAQPVHAAAQRRSTRFGGNKPHSLYAGVAESPELRRLQAIHERICQTLGLDAGAAQIHPACDVGALARSRFDRAFIAISASHSLYNSRLFEVDRFVLFSSRPSRGGGPYAVEEAYSLGAAM